MSRFKRGGLLILIMLIFQCVFSQEDYKSGYVIKNNSDTIFGLIEHKAWRGNPVAIQFKTAIGNETVSYRPADIAEFGFGEEIYISHKVEVGVSSMQMGELELDAQLKTETETVFLQTLFDGEKSLYYYVSALGVNNFYIKQDTSLNLLVYKKYIKKVEHDNKTFAMENKRYIGQLLVYLNECERINSKIQNTSYNKSSLIKVFQQYYECTSTAVSFQRKTQKFDFEFGVLAGVSLTSLEFTSNGEFSYLINTDYSSSINVSAGLFIDVILPVTKGRWSINNELLLSSYKVKGSYTDFKDEDYYSITDTEFGYSYLKINTLLRYKHPVGNVFLFFNGGMSNGLAISETNYKLVESKFHSSERLVEGLALNEARKYERGIILGAGVKYTRFSCEMRYENGNGMSNYGPLGAVTKRFYLLFSYRL